MTNEVMVDNKYTGRYKQGKPRPEEPCLSAVEVTCSDTEDLSLVSSHIFIGTGGDLRILLYNDELPVTFKNVQDGTVLAVKAIRIYKTGTTCEDIISMY